MNFYRIIHLSKSKEDVIKTHFSPFVGLTLPKGIYKLNTWLSGGVCVCVCVCLHTACVTSYSFHLLSLPSLTTYPTPTTAPDLPPPLSPPPSCSTPSSK